MTTKSTTRHYHYTSKVGNCHASNATPDEFSCPFNNGPAVICLSSAPLALTVEEAAKELHIAISNMYKLTKTEGFPAFWIGHSLRINRAMLQEWMNEKTKEQLAKLKQGEAERSCELEVAQAQEKIETE